MIGRATLAGLLLGSYLASQDLRAEVEPAAEQPSCCRIPSRFASQAPAVAAIEPVEEGLSVSLAGEPFAVYRLGEPGQPIVWPIFGPSGHKMTRSYPLTPAQPGESSDHPHHRSFWFSHGDVNGHDFWHTSDAPSEKSPRIVHREITSQQVVGGVAVIETTSDWLASGERLLTDRRTLRFGKLPSVSTSQPPRYIDFAIQLTAPDQPVTFGDTKEGTFAVRAPGTMKADAGLGGRIWNDAGQDNESAWGRPAAWVVYEGPLATREGEEPLAVGGIALMSSPNNARPRPRWHVRGYGLFAANPFGERDFPSGPSRQGAMTIRSGESITLRFAAVFYARVIDRETVDRWYTEVFDRETR